MRQFIAAATLLALTAFTHAGDTELPDAVKQAFKARFGDAVIQEVKKENENGKTQYEIEFKDKAGVEGEAEYGADGTLISEAREIKVADLPAAVRSAIETKYPGAKIEEAKLETENGVQHYEVEIETAGDKDIELTVSADGTKVEVEKDEHDGKDAKDGKSAK